MKHQLEYHTRINVPKDFAFHWHEQPGAFERLAPPWETLRIQERSGGIKDGGKLVFQVKTPAGIWMTWQAEHFDYKRNEQFCDRQVSGPFKSWEHRHVFSTDADGMCHLSDRVEYSLPCEKLGSDISHPFIAGKIRSMFNYRTAATKNDIERIYNVDAKPMKIAVSGAGGLVGGSLIPFLQTGGHETLAISRSASDRKKDKVKWDPYSHLSDKSLEKLEGIDAVVHLAGEPVMGVWTAEKRKRIRESRVEGTRNLCESLAKLDKKPSVLVCASAIGYYGDHGPDKITEESPPGDSFLSEVAMEWEEATAPAREAGIRVVNIRIGIVLSPKGGALAAMLTPFKLGLGGKLGNGGQYMSWIALDDLVYAIYHCLTDESVEGPVNGTAPKPVTNGKFTKTLASVLGRPAILPAPAFLLKMAPGNMGEEMFLSSMRVIPEKLIKSGFKFQFNHLEDALRHLLGKEDSSESSILSA